MLDLIRKHWDSTTIGSIDHTIVKAPYIRLEEYTKGEKGDYIFKYDFRFTQPNTRYIDADVLHSLEHLLLVGLKKSMKGFINIAPMGCQTGFYLILINECQPSIISSHIDRVLKDMLSANEVPLRNLKCCGHAANHNLEGAQNIAKEILTWKKDWLKVI